MRLSITKNKNSSSFYVIKSVIINGKRTSKVVEKLGNLTEVKIKANGKDPYTWAKEYVDLLNKEEQENSNDILLKLSQVKTPDKNVKVKFNAGYLFLQDIYYDLKINDICNKISNKYQFKYDLNDILSKLIYSRIIYPSSKLKTFELCKNFIEQPNFELHDIYRALETIAKESDFIQSELYKNSLNYSKRNDKILFYDCTNYYFEIEEENGDKQYGVSKQHQPNPLIGMGLFLDGDGIPLTFDTFPGNKNEQLTLKPLEEKIINDFGNSKFVVCTDAGLASIANRKFNDTNSRKFVTTQSIKKLKDYQKEWSLDLSKGWHLPGHSQLFDISKLRNDDDLINKFYDKVFYKERWINENGLEQRLIVTFSPKYQEYQKRIRENQLERAKKIIESGVRKLGKSKPNDPKRFIETISTTINGEVAEKNYYKINEDIITEEAKYDGIYAVCTNLEDDVSEIIKINKRRWEIEESFRIMKTEFKARPIYLSKDERIKAHFTTCFLALTIYRYLEKKLDEKYTTQQIIENIKEYNFREFKGFGYVPIYTYNDLIEELHSKFNIDTNKEIIEHKKMKKIINKTKK